VVPNMAIREPRRSPRTRFARAERRWHSYQRAIGLSASALGGNWRLRADELYELLRVGAKAINSHRRGTSAQAGPQELEHVVKKIAGADDWRRRLSVSLRGLPTEAVQAVGKLVKLGCVPDALLWCISAYSKGSSARDAQKNRDVVHRTLLRKLAGEFDRAADACWTYLRKTDELHLDRVMELEAPYRFRAEAGRFRTRVEELDARRKRGWTSADSALFVTMRETKTITGKFQDELLADILRGTPGAAAITGEVLRKWRTRNFPKDRAS